MPVHLGSISSHSRGTAPTSVRLSVAKCRRHFDCPADKYCAKGKDEAGKTYQECKPLADCAKSNDGVDLSCPGNEYPQT